jgi:eukaryotic-like serine/threonine-protein kinase
MSTLEHSCVEPSSLRGLLNDPVPGTGYRALRRLGGGTTSEVFEALAPDDSRCAIKVLRDLFVDSPDESARFEQEAAALGSLDHPSLAPVIDAGITAEGRPFFVMPLIEGETLKHRLAKVSRISPRAACAIAVDVLEALDVAHRANVVHRDVKPGNVLLPPIGANRPAVLLDFGVAKLHGAHKGRSTEARIVGTPRYLTPEQIVGGAVDGRTDVYALGLVLFEMIAGRGPFDADTPIDLMRAHLEDTCPALSRFARVSRGLEHAVTKAVAKSPARRWPSARVFAEVLRRSTELATRPTVSRAVEVAP